jgi:hypothetical protein
MEHSKNYDGRKKILFEANQTLVDPIVSKQIKKELVLNGPNVITA